MYNYKITTKVQKLRFYLGNCIPKRTKLLALLKYFKKYDNFDSFSENQLSIGFKCYFVVFSLLHLQRYYKSPLKICP